MPDWLLSLTACIARTKHLHDTPGSTSLPDIRTSFSLVKLIQSIKLTIIAYFVKLWVSKIICANGTHNHESQG